MLWLQSVWLDATPYSCIGSDSRLKVWLFQQFLFWAVEISLNNRAPVSELEQIVQLQCVIHSGITAVAATAFSFQPLVFVSSWILCKFGVFQILSANLGWKYRFCCVCAILLDLVSRFVLDRLFGSRIFRSERNIEYFSKQSNPRWVDDNVRYLSVSQTWQFYSSCYLYD